MKIQTQEHKKCVFSSPPPTMPRAWQLSSTAVAAEAQGGIVSAVERDFPPYYLAAAGDGVVFVAWRHFFPIYISTCICIYICCLLSVVGRLSLSRRPARFLFSTDALKRVSSTLSIGNPSVERVGVLQPPYACCSPRVRQACPKMDPVVSPGWAGGRGG